MIGWYEQWRGISKGLPEISLDLVLRRQVHLLKHLRRDGEAVGRLHRLERMGLLLVFAGRIVVVTDRSAISFLRVSARMSETETRLCEIQLWNHRHRRLGIRRFGHLAGIEGMRS